MAISLKHAFESAVPDGGDASLVRPSNWNAEHILLVATGILLGRATAGDGAAEELTPAQVRTLLNVEDGAAADMSAAEILAALLTVDGTGSALDADLLDGNEASAFQSAAANLDTWATLEPSADAQSLVTAATYAAMRTLLDLEPGTDFYSIAGADAEFLSPAEGDAAYQPLDSDLTAIAALTTTSFGRALLESASASALYAAIKQTATESATGASEWATTAEVRAADAAGNQVIRVRSINEASESAALTDAATVAIDWIAGINFTLTLTTDRILGNPTNEIPGTFRMVFVISDGGPDELTFGSEYGGTPPTLDDITTTKGYLLTIFCRAVGQFIVTAVDGSPA
jgi:hypothetical protein